MSHQTKNFINKSKILWYQWTQESNLIIICTLLIICGVLTEDLLSEKEIEELMVGKFIISIFFINFIILIPLYLKRITIDKNNPIIQSYLDSAKAEKNYKEEIEIIKKLTYELNDLYMKNKALIEAIELPLILRTTEHLINSSHIL